jgi:hypothetical protein
VIFNYTSAFVRPFESNMGFFVSIMPVIVEPDDWFVTVIDYSKRFYCILRGWAGPSLLAMILYEKFAAHQPLNRKRRLFPT